MHYTRCCMLGFIHYQLIINVKLPKILSFEALPFLKKLVFRVGKKALADRQALLQFLDVVWLVRIAIVLGCACWLSLQYNIYFSWLQRTITIKFGLSPCIFIQRLFYNLYFMQWKMFF